MQLRIRQWSYELRGSGISRADAITTTVGENVTLFGNNNAQQNGTLHWGVNTQSATQLISPIRLLINSNKVLLKTL